MKQFTTSFPTTHTSLVAIIRDIDSLRDRVVELLDTQSDHRHVAHPYRRMNIHDPYQNNQPHYPSSSTYIPWRAEASMRQYPFHHSTPPRHHHYYPPSPNLVLPSPSLSPSPVPPRSVYYRKGAGAWQPPVSRGKPGVGRSAPDRRGRRDEGWKGKGRERKRRRVESGGEISESSVIEDGEDMEDGTERKDEGEGDDGKERGDEHRDGHGDMNGREGGGAGIVVGM